MRKTYGLGGTFNLDEAHTAVASNGKSFVVTETGNLNTGFLTSLVDCVRAIDL